MNNYFNLGLYIYDQTIGSDQIGLLSKVNQSNEDILYIIELMNTKLMRSLYWASKVNNRQSFNGYFKEIIRAAI